MTVSLSPAATQLQLTAGSSNVNSQQGHANNVPAILPPHPAVLPHPSEGHVGYLSTPRNDTDFGAARIEDPFPAVHFGFKQLATLNATFVFSHEFLEFGKELLPFAADWLMAMENKELKAITMLLAALLVVIFRFLLRNPLDMSNSYRMSSASVRTNDSVGSYGGITALPVELGDGSIQVGDRTTTLIVVYNLIMVFSESETHISIVNPYRTVTYLGGKDHLRHQRHPRQGVRRHVRIPRPLRQS